MYKRLFGAALIFGAAAMAPPVQAQTVNCMPREALIESLQMKFGESLTGGGLQNAQQLLEIWSSETTGSFTVLITRADGVSCVVAAGKHWNSADLPMQEGVAG